MADLFKWRIYCITDSRFEYIWDTAQPNICPINSTHQINVMSVADMVTVNKYRVVNSNESPYLTSGYNLYRCNSSGGDIKFMLKPANGIDKGRVIIIQKLTNQNTVTICPHGLDKIDGDIVKILTFDKETIKIQSNGVNWKILEIETLTGELNEELEGKLYCDPYNNDELVMYNNNDFRKLKLNLTATKDPTTNDDQTFGYGVGSRWINLTTDIEFICVDSTINAAIWKETTCCDNTLPGKGLTKTNSIMDVNVDNKSIGIYSNQLKIINPPINKGDLFTHDGYMQQNLPVGINNQILIADSSQPMGLRWDNYGSQCWILVDEKPSSTNGGTATAGGWHVRDINKIEVTCGPEVTLDYYCNRFKILPGKYTFFVTTSFCKTKGTRIRLYNVTDSEQVASGVNIWADTHSNCILCTCIVLDKITTFELQYKCCSSQLNNGLGSALGLDNEPEKYTIIKIVK